MIKELREGKEEKKEQVGEVKFEDMNNTKGW